MFLEYRIFLLLLLLLLFIKFNLFANFSFKVLIHTGHYTPPQSLSEWTSNYPDHDLCVTIRVLPKLVQYTSTVRDGYRSRSWGNHHGVSYKIESVCKMKVKFPWNYRSNDLN